MRPLHFGLYAYKTNIPLDRVLRFAPCVHNESSGACRSLEENMDLKKGLMLCCSERKRIYVSDDILAMLIIA